MSDLLDKLHADAGLSLLHGVCDVLSPPIPVYDGVVPAQAARPYVLVYTEISRPRLADGNALDGKSATFLVRWYCHCVGETAAAARAVGMEVRTALLDVRPTIAGRACDMVRQDVVQPPTRDETLGYPVMDEVQVYSLATLPG
jgi:hypothetical protein